MSLRYVGSFYVDQAAIHKNIILHTFDTTVISFNPTSGDLWMLLEWGVGGVDSSRSPKIAMKTPNYLFGNSNCPQIWLFLEFFLPTKNHIRRAVGE